MNASLSEKCRQVPVIRSASDLCAVKLRNRRATDRELLVGRGYPLHVAVVGAGHDPFHRRPFVSYELGFQVETEIGEGGKNCFGERTRLAIAMRADAEGHIFLNTVLGVL